MSYSAAVLADTPTAYYRLGDAAGTTATDETGNFNGTYTGVTLGATSLLSNDANTCVSFDSIDDDVELGILSSNGASAGWTWEIWLNTGYTGFAIPPIIGESTFSANALRLIQIQGATTWDLRADMETTDWTAVTGLPYDTTMHIVFTVEDAQTTSPITRMYRDGTQVAVKSDYGAAQLTPYRVQYLNVRDGGNRRFLGRMDEVAFYTYALSAARVQAHYDAAFPTAPVLSSTGKTATTVDLAWTDEGSAEWQVDRDGTRIAVTSGLTYQDTGLSPSTGYTYRVRGRDIT